jgi:hypothetical protein
MVKIRDSGGTSRTITRIRMRDETGTLRTIQRIRIKDSTGTLRTVFSAFGISLSTDQETKVDSGASYTGSVTSDAVTVTVTSGTGPYTYSWARTSGDSSVGITSPTAASTTFAATVYEGYPLTAHFRVTVTDTATGTTATADVTVTLVWVNTA